MANKSRIPAHPRNSRYGWTRRQFFQTSGVSAVTASALLTQCSGGRALSGNVPTYDQLGVRPVVNAAGTYTIIGGSLVLPEVDAAMEAASHGYVHLDELMEAIGARLAELTGAEWGLITSGCAAALCQVTAACVAGSDPEKLARLPETTGMKNEVIAQKIHRHTYDHAIRQVGVKIITVETRDELLAAISDRTAMFSVLGEREEDAQVSVKELSKISKQYNIPILVDAAAERPDIPNRYLEDGADIVAYSGGKCMRGPQCTGMVLGRKDICQAAFLHGSPHHAIGRPMKVGKEEAMGLLAAVEAWILTRDHDAEWKEWENRLAHVESAVADLPTITTDIALPKRSNYTPILEIGWDAATIQATASEISEILYHGTPRIYLKTNKDKLRVNPYMMEPSDYLVVADNLRKVLQSKI